MPRFAASGSGSASGGALGGSKGPERRRSVTAASGRGGIQKVSEYTVTDSTEELREMPPAGRYTATVTRGSEKAPSTDGESDGGYGARESGIRKTVAYNVSDGM